MRKSRIILVLILAYSAVLLAFPDLITWSTIFPNTVMAGVALNALIFIGLTLCGAYFYLQEKQLGAKEITFIAIYSTFTAVARIPFAGLPNIQPCTFLIFIAGVVFGPLIGFMIGGNTAFLSNMFLGHGPWTVYQIIAWGLVGVVGGVFQPLKRKLSNKMYVISLSFLLFLLGFVYGAITNIWSWLLVSPITWESFLVLYSTSFFFDLAHGLSNFIFMLFFGEKTANILNRYRDRFYLQIEQPENGQTREDEEIYSVKS